MSSGPTPPGSVSGAPTTYKVEDGDTLFTIALSRGLDYDAVLKLNPSVGPSGAVKPGEILRLPSAGPSDADEWTRRSDVPEIGQGETVEEDAEDAGSKDSLGEAPPPASSSDAFGVPAFTPTGVPPVVDTVAKAEAAEMMEAPREEEEKEEEKGKKEEEKGEKEEEKGKKEEEKGKKEEEEADASLSAAWDRSDAEAAVQPGSGARFFAAPDGAPRPAPPPNHRRPNKIFQNTRSTGPPDRQRELLQQRQQFLQDQRRRRQSGMDGGGIGRVAAAAVEGARGAVESISKQYSKSRSESTNDLKRISANLESSIGINPGSAHGKLQEVQDGIRNLVESVMCTFQQVPRLSVTSEDKVKADRDAARKAKTQDPEKERRATLNKRAKEVTDERSLALPFFPKQLSDTEVQNRAKHGSALASTSGKKAGSNAFVKGAFVGAVAVNLVPAIKPVVAFLRDPDRIITVKEKTKAARGWARAAAAVTGEALNGKVGVARGVKWDGAHLVLAIRLPGELECMSATAEDGTDGAEDEEILGAADVALDEHTCRRLDLPARIGPAWSYAHLVTPESMATKKAAVRKVAAAARRWLREVPRALKARLPRRAHAGVAAGAGGAEAGGVDAEATEETGEGVTTAAAAEEDKAEVESRAVKAKQQAETEAKARAAKEKAEAEAKAAAEAQAKAAAEAQAKAAAEAQAKAAAEAQAKAAAEAQAKAAAEAQAKAAAEAQAKAAAEAQAKAAAEAQAKAAAEAQAQAQAARDREQANAEARAEREKAEAEAEVAREKAEAEAKADREKVVAEAKAAMEKAEAEAKAAALATAEAEARAEAAAKSPAPIESPDPTTPDKNQQVTPDSVTPPRAHRRMNGAADGSNDSPEVTPRTAAAVGLNMVTPDPTPRGKSSADRAGHQSSPSLDFSEMLSPRGKDDKLGYNDCMLLIQKLQGRKEALWKSYAQLEQLEGREAKMENFQILHTTPRNSEIASTPSRDDPASPGGSASKRPSFVPPLELHKVPGFAGEETAEATESRSPADGPVPAADSPMSPTRRRDREMLKSAQVVTNGIRSFNALSDGEPNGDSASEGAIAAAVESGDATPEMVEHVERLNRECAVLEGRLQYRSDNQAKELERTRAEREAKTKALERAEVEVAEMRKMLEASGRSRDEDAAAGAELTRKSDVAAAAAADVAAAVAAEKQAEAALAHQKRVKKSIWHFTMSLKRRAVLGWLFELDEAHRRRRLLRKALARMKLRTLSSSFEAWVEFQRRAKDVRLERRVAELEKRAAEAEAAEAAARAARDAAARVAAETAELVAAAERREAEARREVAELRSAQNTPRGGPESQPGSTATTPRGSKKSSFTTRMMRAFSSSKSSKSGSTTPRSGNVTPR